MTSVRAEYLTLNASSDLNNTSKSKLTNDSTPNALEENKPIKNHYLRANFRHTMKKLIFFAAAAGLYACGGADHAGHDHETNETAVIAVNAYGAQFDTTGASLFKNAEFAEGKTDGTYKATIVESCQKMGCWMKVEHPEQGEVMVFMNDHEFFVPKTGVSGLTAYINGTAYWDTTTVDLQKHLLEDGNAAQEDIDAITEDKYELQFNAIGVVILGYEGSEEAEGHDHDHEGHDHEGHDHDHEGHDHSAEESPSQTTEAN